MIYGETRTETRTFFFTVWEKYQKKIPLEPLESQILTVILEHPEYHFIFEKKETALTQDFFIEKSLPNPFLHFGLHIAIREQLQLQRPAQIVPLYQKLLRLHQDSHTAEHTLMNCFMDVMWQAQKKQQPFNEADYIHQLTQKIKS